MIDLTLSDEEQIARYGHYDLMAIPDEMGPWNLRLDNPIPSGYGYFSVVKIEQSSIELHHQAVVLDEHGEPLNDVGVGFFYPGGDGPAAPMPRRNYWRQAPIVNPTGNWQMTDYGGYVEHTFNAGGETIVCWEIDATGDLLYPSAAIYNATWTDTVFGRFNHTGIRVTFQLRRMNVVPMSRNLLRQKVIELESRVKWLEQ